MPLQLGTTLGPYEVTAKIGEGGMGEVYQACDTKLDRDVALKVLPEAFTSDPDRLVRFEREAKVLASLNHPNIGSIYGLEEAEGVKALVLELIEGPTLADRIAKGPIPIDDALPIAKQIAEALEAAHEQGVIHRDLKPANVKVKADGTVKVLDFGLAKAFQPEASDASASLSPTISLTAAATQMGMVIGTAAYMAPEQAKGQVVDKRADIWAYGAVLFEMLTGKKLFEAGDVSEMLASVLVKDPDVSSMGDHVPPHVRAVLRQCLVKDPKERMRDIGDVRLALSGVLQPTRSDAQVGMNHEAAARPRGLWKLLPWAIAAVAVAAALLVTARSGSESSSQVTRLPITIGDYEPSGPGFLEMSPDGSRFVYGHPSGGLYLRELDQFEPRLLQEFALSPFFSPDGQSVGFFNEANELMRVSVGGGTRFRSVRRPSRLVPRGAVTM